MIKTDYAYEQVKEELNSFHYDQYHLINPQIAIAFRNVFYRYKYNRSDYDCSMYDYERQLAKEGLLLMFNTGWLKEPAFVEWYLFSGVTHQDGLVALDRFLACIDDQHMRVAIAQHIKEFVYPEKSLFALILEREKIALAAIEKQPKEIPQTAAYAYIQLFPRKGDYNGVREYVEERKKYDEIFKQYCQTHTRKQLCHRLTDEFGWTVDDNSYGKNISRNM